MRESINKAVEITKILGISLSWRKLVLFLFLYPLSLGAIAGFFQGNITFGMILFLSAFSMPGLFLTFLAKLMFRKPKLKQVFVASTSGSAIYATVFFMALAFSSFLQKQWIESAVIISGLLASLLWYTAGAIVFKKPKTAVFFALLQFIVYTSALSLMVGNLSMQMLAFKFIIASVIFAIATGLAFYMASMPIKKGFGYSGTETLRMFLAQWIYKEKDLEKPLSDFSEKAIVNNGLVIFSNKEKKFAFAVPNFHFGPFGMLSSSYFPAFLRNKMNNTLVFHGTATHEMNLANSEEMKKATSTFIEKISELDGKNSEFSFIEESEGKAKAHALVFGKDAFVFVSREPNTTEDIEYSLGCIMREKSLSKFRETAIADMHNSEGKDITYFSILSREGNEYAKAVQNLSSAKKIDYKKLQAGFEFLEKENLLKSNKSLGHGGISIASFAWKFPIILVNIDGNSITGSAKELIEKKITEKIKNARILVFTTDTHEQNTVSGIVNDFECTEFEAELIAEKALSACKKMEQFKASVYNIEMGLKILGKESSTEILSTINSTVAVAKILFPVGMTVGIILSMYALSII